LLSVFRRERPVAVPGKINCCCVAGSSQVAVAPELLQRFAEENFDRGRGV